MRKFLLSGFISCLLIACTERIDIDTNDSEPVLVIYGVITDEFKQQEIRISRSAPYFSDLPTEAISDARVIVQSSDNKTYEFQEQPENKGYYYSSKPWAAKPDVEYQLSIEVDFNRDGQLDRYEASTTVLPTGNLDSIRIVPQTIMGHLNYSLNIYGQDAETTDYYLFRFVLNDASVSGKLSQYVLVDDALLNGQYINGLTLRFFDDISERENDSPERQRLSVYLTAGDRVDVEMSIVPKGYYDFIIQAVDELSRQNPMFGSPPANITTNISNGAVGYFAGYCISKIGAVVPEKKL
jgi:hypothetical protein